MIVNYLLALSWRVYLGAIVNLSISALIMGAIVRLSWYWLESKAGVGFFSAAILVALGAAVYSFCVLILERAYVNNIAKLMSHAREVEGVTITNPFQ